MRPDDEASDAPARLVADLSALVPPAHIPADVDQAILARARGALAARRRRRILVRALPVALAASLALWFALGRRPRDARGLAADVDGSGRVDIVDAYVLALRIEERSVSPSDGARWDLNQDGALDRLDVDRVANEAVRLGS